AAPAAERLRWGERRTPMLEKKDLRSEANTRPAATGGRVLWFLVGAITTFAVFRVLALNERIQTFSWFKWFEFKQVTGIDAAPPDGPPWVVTFSFNEKGGALLQELTRKNLPSGNGGKKETIKRHLAILREGSVLSAPTINSEIGMHGQITDVAEEDVDPL